MFTIYTVDWNVFVLDWAQVEGHITLVFKDLTVTVRKN